MADFLTLCATLREALEKLTPGPWLQDSDKPHTVLAVEGGYIGSVLYNVNEHDVPGIVLLRNHVPTLLDGIETLQRELQRCRAVGWSSAYLAEARNREREQENARLREALAPYISHRQGCPALDQRICSQPGCGEFHERPCTCGLRVALGGGQ